MRKPITRSLVAVGALGALALAASRLGLIGSGAPTPAGVLPLTCRLRGHGWRVPRTNSQTPIRRTCSRCEQVDLPLP
ncbi:hypothetical protein [Nocardioides sp. zg-DK7169]|uniref:hypothetical protein n=1 Tax=Nocardioides sp. zg-DK7169 TaxID=2736600 RepID=UPI001551B948|nr:hypothetical protein [Nocardioides sp. zg-DK7169]NPC98377.1 hypothetical protein [Nocardioides sp. zg-DK7169]